jgi:hypothetical protein
VAGYSGFRIFEELLRVDPSHHVFGLRLNLYVASVLTLAGTYWFVRIQRGGGWPGRSAGAASSRARRGAAGLGVAVLVLGATGCGFSSRASASASLTVHATAAYSPHAPPSTTRGAP